MKTEGLVYEGEPRCEGKGKGLGGDCALIKRGLKYLWRKVISDNTRMDCSLSCVCVVLKRRTVENK